MNIHLALADTLGVKRSTARSIVAKYNRGGRNNVKVDEEMKECLNEIVNENCHLTLKQINEELRGRLPDQINRLYAIGP